LWLRPKGYVLLDIEGKEWKVKNQRNPISIDEEQKGEETMNRSFRNDVGVQTVAEIDRVDVVTVIEDTLVKLQHYM